MKPPVLLPRLLTATDVTDVKSFASYANQTLGTAIPRGKDWGRLVGTCNQFFQDNPRASWATLVHIIDWARGKRKRYVDAWMLVAAWKWAFRDGALPELDPTSCYRSDPRVEFAITEALRVETEEYWRRMLIGAEGMTYRQMALEAWRKHREEMTDALL